MSTQTVEQCVAVTQDGERCSNSATDGRFCHQHDENDETVDDEDVDTARRESSDGDETEQADSSQDDAADDAAETAESATEDSGDESFESNGILGVHEAAFEICRKLIGSEPDRIVEVDAVDDGWEVTVEVVERPAVPDTQDILGSYRLELSADHELEGYRRLERYRRASMERGDAAE